MFLFETCLFCRGKKSFLLYRPIQESCCSSFLCFIRRSFISMAQAISCLSSPIVDNYQEWLSWWLPFHLYLPTYTLNQAMNQLIQITWDQLCRSQNIVSLMFQGFRDHNYDVIGIIMDLSTIFVKRVGFDTFFKQRSE